MRIILSLLAGLTLIGCTQDTSNSSVISPGQSSTTAHDHSQHSHGTVEVTAIDEQAPVPTINFTVSADSMGGWNIHILTDHFRFTPEKVNGTASSGEGHAHIFVDDFKMARVYGHWFHLKKLTPGNHNIRITLNANDHRQWSHDGQVISSSQMIEQL